MYFNHNGRDATGLANCWESYLKCALDNKSQETMLYACFIHEEANSSHVRTTINKWYQINHKELPIQSGEFKLRTRERHDEYDITVSNYMPESRKRNMYKNTQVPYSKFKKWGYYLKSQIKFTEDFLYQYNHSSS